MTKLIEFADKLALPPDAATQTIAFLARKRAGKSYAAGKLAEGFWEHDVQFVVLDPVGNWYGLRIAADGKGTGIDVIILGGLRGDIPLDPSAGALIADTVLDSGRSFVLDVSQFSLGERKRFVQAFGERLWQRQKGLADPQPIHVFLEEAQLFIPQSPMPEERPMLGIWTEIVRLGGNKGIGVTIISQRPQSVAKEALTQVECLVVLQVNGVPEKKALKEWIVEKGLETKLLEELPFLKRGVAYIWSPQWLEHFGKHEIKAKWTYDAGATPKVGVKKVQAELKPIDLEVLRSKMAEAVQKMEENDPKKLKKRVADLEKQLVNLMQAAQKQMQAAPTGKTERVEVPVLHDHERKMMEKHIAAAQHLQEKAGEYIDRLGEIAQNLGTSMKELATSTQNMVTVARARIASAPPSKAAPASKPVHTNGALASSRFQAAPPKPTKPANGHSSLSPSDEERRLGRGARDMLKALAGRHPTPLSKGQAATLARVPPRKSTFRNSMSELRTGEYVREEGDILHITEKGLAYVGDDIEIVQPTTEELMTMWGKRFPAKVNEMLKIIVEAYPNSITHEELGERTGVDIGISTYRNCMSKMRSNSLIVTTKTDVRASDTLFPE